MHERQPLALQADQMFIVFASFRTEQDCMKASLSAPSPLLSLLINACCRVVFLARSAT